MKEKLMEGHFEKQLWEYVFFSEKIILQSPMYFYLALELTSYVARILKDLLNQFRTEAKIYSTLILF